MHIDLYDKAVKKSEALAIELEEEKINADSLALKVNILTTQNNILNQKNSDFQRQTKTLSEEYEKAKQFQAENYHCLNKKFQNEINEAKKLREDFDLLNERSRTIQDQCETLQRAKINLDCQILNLKIKNNSLEEQLNSEKSASKILKENNAIINEKYNKALLKNEDLKQELLQNLNNQENFLLEKNLDEKLVCEKKKCEMLIEKLKVQENKCLAVQERLQKELKSFQDSNSRLNDELRTNLNSLRNNEEQLKVKNEKETALTNELEKKNKNVEKLNNIISDLNEQVTNNQDIAKKFNLIVHKLNSTPFNEYVISNQNIKHSSNVCETDGCLGYSNTNIKFFSHKK